MGTYIILALAALAVVVLYLNKRAQKTGPNYTQALQTVGALIGKF